MLIMVLRRQTERTQGRTGLPLLFGNCNGRVFRRFIKIYKRHVQIMHGNVAHRENRRNLLSNCSTIPTSCVNLPFENEESTPEWCHHPYLIARIWETFWAMVWYGMAPASMAMPENFAQLPNGGYLETKSGTSCRNRSASNCVVAVKSPPSLSDVQCRFEFRVQPCHRFDVGHVLTSLTQLPRIICHSQQTPVVTSAVVKFWKKNPWQLLFKIPCGKLFSED
jgi:hypothetical protein